jgi:hypothetical protein
MSKDFKKVFEGADKTVAYWEERCKLAEDELTRSNKAIQKAAVLFTKKYKTELVMQKAMLRGMEIVTGLAKKTSEGLNS